MKTIQYASLTASKKVNGRAVVIGSGVAGLVTVRVLVKYFNEIYLIDRDQLPDEPAFRAGIPQALHAHTLLPYGQQILEKLFPGVVDRLVASGAQTMDDPHDIAIYENGQWHNPVMKTSRHTVSSSRPFLEGTLYHEIIAFPQVRVCQGYEVTGLVTDPSNSRVTGVTVRNRQSPGNGQQNIRAELVVDASGRNSKAPLWLAARGYVPPEEWRINAFAGYSSRIYRQPDGKRYDWKKLVIQPEPPDCTRGGVILPLEGNRWHVTVFGVASDYPPTDEEGFLEFARGLSAPDLYEAIQAAEPLSKIFGYRKNENRARRFENLPRYLEGLLVLGDAVYTMNPVYALGMTAALASGQVLDQVFRDMQKEKDSDGLSAIFQKKLSLSLSTLWQQAVRGDWRWPATDISDNTEELYSA
jgi:2-polyprenyl-6-methoxyphenol hydroxylase-like FAD-dependent oxidoreductase